MPQKNLCPNAVCGSDLVFLFNSLNTIIMGGGRILPCFITALLHPPIPLLKKEKKNKNKNISQVFVPLWLLWPVAGDSHCWVAGVKGLVSSRMHVSVWVGAPVLPRWLMPLKAGDVQERGVTRGSVQSQEWLSVLILALLLMFQGPSFYHWLRSNNREQKEKDTITNISLWQQLWNLEEHSDFTFSLLINTLKIATSFLPLCSPVFLALVSFIPYFYGERHLESPWQKSHLLMNTCFSYYPAPMSEHSVALEMCKVK